MLPSMVNQALEANDRAKYYLTLLQACAARARLPGHRTPSLHGERLAAGINEQWLDQVVASSEASDDDDSVRCRHAREEVHDALMGAVGEMLRPLAVAEVEESPDPARLERLRCGRRISPATGCLTTTSSESRRLTPRSVIRCISW